ncbi:hypothetical protein [Maribacter ulvicola]|uniref:Uncharacterized protein n=1 Tax=Maribacter ulvicola TaxID=228959 RepID=A0A1N6QXN1_9FLAO|nr:hypothetical protein [Maribacter ulvicola]SIQ21096.1 hypothetical protein SAMN05421797_1011054 [Maribacter ulvicola]
MELDKHHNRFVLVNDSSSEVTRIFKFTGQKALVKEHNLTNGLWLKSHN